MTAVYIILGLVIIVLIRIFGLVKDVKIWTQNTNHKIDFMYDQAEKNKKEN